MTYRAMTRRPTPMTALFTVSLRRLVVVRLHVCVERKYDDDAPQ